jgi:hypothetical protein
VVADVNFTLMPVALNGMDAGFAENYSFGLGIAIALTLPDLPRKLARRGR